MLCIGMVMVSMTHTNTKQPKNLPSKQERTLSLVLLAVLFVIGAGVWAIQFHFDPASWQAQSQLDGAASQPKQKGSQAPPVSNLPADLSALSPLETYDSETLSDKINGKAELYLSAGFKRLQSRRFALVSDPQLWMERYVYDMGRYRNAFAVFSAQRRPNIEPLTLTSQAYQSANGLFMVHGRYYVEIIGAQVSAALRSKMADLAQAFVASRAVSSQALDEPGLFPQQDRVAHSITLIAANAFGFDRLDWIYTAQYRWQQAEAIAFVARRASSAEAQELAGAYVAFLSDYGGRTITPPAEVKSAQIIDIMDNFEIMLSRGPYIYGVHEATDLQRAISLAARLQRNVQEAARGE